MATSNTFSITAGVTSFACDFGATDKETIVLTISSTGAVISSNDYSILGVAASATAGDITIEWDDAGDYVGETLIISKFTEIDTGSPSDAMLVDFTSSGTTNPTNIQNEFAHLYDIISQITDGTAVGTYDIADIGTLIARLNDLADDIFTTTTNSGTPAIWDGANTLSIASLSNVQAILEAFETSINNLSSQVISTAGLPASSASTTNAAAAGGYPLYVLGVDTLNAVEWIDLLTQVLALTGGTLTGALTITAGSANPLIVHGDNAANADGVISLRKDAAATNMDGVFRIAANDGTALSDFGRIEHGSTLTGTRMWDNDRQKGAYITTYDGSSTGTGKSGAYIWVDDNGNRTWAIPMWVCGGDVDGTTTPITIDATAGHSGNGYMQRPGNLNAGASGAATARVATIERNGANVGRYDLWLPTSLDTSGCVLMVTPYDQACMWSIKTVASSADGWQIQLYDAAGTGVDAKFGVTVLRLT